MTTINLLDALGAFAVIAALAACLYWFITRRDLRIRKRYRKRKQIENGRTRDHFRNARKALKDLGAMEEDFEKRLRELEEKLTNVGERQ